MLTKGIDLIEKHGFLLVFPIKNRSEPNSLWNCLYPNSEMRWVWDENGDNRVGKLWILREQLAASRKVVYGKFYQNRATFFSREIFKCLLALIEPWKMTQSSLAEKALLEALDMDSPLSTKQLRKQSELSGKFFEPAFNRGTKNLWQQLQIVGMGEIDDGAFPSLAYASTKIVFEDLWNEAKRIDPMEAYFKLQELEEFPLLEKTLLKNVLNFTSVQPAPDSVSDS